MIHQFMALRHSILLQIYKNIIDLYGIVILVGVKILY